MAACVTMRNTGCDLYLKMNTVYCTIDRTILVGAAIEVTAARVTLRYAASFSLYNEPLVDSGMPGRNRENMG